MAAGVKFGRKRKLSDYQRDEAVKRRAAGETLASIAKSYGVHLAMISPALMPLRFYRRFRAKIGVAPCSGLRRRITHA